jgi:type II secretory pathway pseudopilin PulG
MGSIANKFVSRSLTLTLFLSLGYLALPVSPVAQGPREAVILDQELKEATRVLKQQQREAQRAQEQVILQRRLGGQFALLQVQATTQHAMIEQWRKAHSSEPNSWSSIEARGGVHKNRFR